MTIIKKTKRLFDYIYYRTYKFYYKWDKETGITAILAVSMLQSLTLGLIFIITLKMFFSKWEIVPYSKNIAWGEGILCLLLTIINHKYYIDKYENFDKIWGNESLKTKRKKGWLIVLLLIIPWIIIFYLGILNRN